MEDWGSQLQNSDKRLNYRKIFRGFFKIFLIFLFLYLCLKFILFMFSIRNDSYVPDDKIKLIESEVEKIKRFPNESYVKKSNINDVYDVISENDNVGVTIVNKSLNDIDLYDLDKKALDDKIEEISTTKTIKTSEPKKNYNTSKIKVNAKKKIIKQENSYSNLDKITNKSLVKNINLKKHVKPGIKVQLMALKNKNELLRYWDILKERYDIFYDKNYYIEDVELENIGIIYRLQVGLFNDVESARNFCSQYIEFTNKNKSDCILINE